MYCVLHLNLVIDRFKCYSACFLIIIIERFYFCCFRVMTQHSILHVVVNWEVFTINIFVNVFDVISNNGWHQW